MCWLPRWFRSYLNIDSWMFFGSNKTPNRSNHLNCRWDNRNWTNILTEAQITRWCWWPEPKSPTNQITFNQSIKELRIVHYANQLRCEQIIFTDSRRKIEWIVNRFRFEVNFFVTHVQCVQHLISNFDTKSTFLCKVRDHTRLASENRSIFSHWFFSFCFFSFQFIWAFIFTLHSNAVFISRWFSFALKLTFTKVDVGKMFVVFFGL